MTARHSCSVTVYFCSAPVRARLAYAITRSCPSIICVSSAPRPTLLASICKEKGNKKSGHARVGAETRRVFKVSNAVCCSVVHSQVCCFLVRRVSGVAIVAKQGMNRRYYEAIPRKRRSCLRFRGAG